MRRCSSWPSTATPGEPAAGKAGRRDQLDGPAVTVGRRVVVIRPLSVVPLFAGAVAGVVVAVFHRDA
jgi:hypothetical protein